MALVTTRGSWLLAEVGDVIVGADGKPWTVINATPAGGVTLDRVSDHKRYTGVPKGDVEYVSAAWLERRAVKTIEHEFGGVTVSKQKDDGTHVCPVDYQSPATILAHLHIFHGLTPPEGEQDLKTLRTVHANQHNTTDQYEPHVHDPDWKEVPS